MKGKEMSDRFSISGQHYLFDVQTFAQVVLATGGDEFHYALYDRTTAQVIEDVSSGLSDVGVMVRTAQTKDTLDKAFDEAGLEFHELIQSAPMVALPSSHPMVNAEALSLEMMADWPYIYFDQGEGAPVEFCEEALAGTPRSKTIACTDRASLSELIVALNGYTITSGILVGISDGAFLKTVPLITDIDLHIGYVCRRGWQPADLEKRFIDKLSVNLVRYASM